MTPGAGQRPTLEELHERMHVVAIPLRTRFRGLDVREAVLLDGPVGWGEFAPFPEYRRAEAAHWLDCAIEAAFVGWPEPRRRTIAVNATMPAVSADRVPQILARYDGCRTVKVKVAERGQGLRDDLDRVAAVRDAIGPAGRIRVDANGAWDLRSAADALMALRGYGLEYAEQPCASVDDLARLRVELARRRADVLIAADESIRRAQDPMAVVRARAADLIVLKVAPLGGVAAALRVASECGLPVVVSSALDTSVGIAAGLALAAALPELAYDCGLATVELLAGDVTADRLVPSAGAIAVRRPAVERSLLAAYSTTNVRKRWWRAWVEQCVTQS